MCVFIFIWLFYRHKRKIIVICFYIKRFVVYLYDNCRFLYGQQEGIYAKKISEIFYAQWEYLLAQRRA